MLPREMPNIDDAYAIAVAFPKPMAPSHADINAVHDALVELRARGLAWTKMRLIAAARLEPRNSPEHPADWLRRCGFLAHEEAVERAIRSKATNDRDGRPGRSGEATTSFQLHRPPQSAPTSTKPANALDQAKRAGERAEAAARARSTLARLEEEGRIDRDALSWVNDQARSSKSALDVLEHAVQTIEAGGTIAAPEAWKRDQETKREGRLAELQRQASTLGARKPSASPTTEPNDESNRT